MDKLRWDSFTLITGDGTAFDHATEPDIYVKCMTRFWQTGRTGNITFGRLGLPHEDEDNPKTWGPPTRNDVDWIGFPARNNLFTVSGAAKAL